MPAFDSTQLAAWTGGRWTSMPATVTSGFGADSRRIGRGQAFVALKTEKRDGHDFVIQAERSGASAAIVARAVAGVSIAQLVVDDPLRALQSIAREHRRTFTGTVIGVTGSAGKTSTKELLSAMLGGDEGGALATSGNLNNHIGVALTLTRIDASRHAYAVVEAGISGPGEMGVLASMIEPDVALVTTVAPAHLEELGGLEGVAREKAVLPGALKDKSRAIFPSSCSSFEAFRALEREKAAVLEPTSRATAPGRVPFAVEHSAQGTRVTVTDRGTPAQVVLRRVSDGMAQNAALALVAALRLGIPLALIRERLGAWTPAPLRGEWRSEPGRTLYLDCYNANPASMADALAVFAEVVPAGGPRLFVIGCMEELGADAERYHEELGRSLRLGAADQLVVVGALAGAVRRGAMLSGASGEQVTVSDSVAPLAESLAAFRGAVFVKGSRRHELEKAFKGAGVEEAAHA